MARRLVLFAVVICGAQALEFAALAARLYVIP